MATSSQATWWRFPAPTTLIGAAILFNLPWLQVQCNGPAGKNVLYTQTGLQTATGGMSQGEGIDQMKQQMGAFAGMAGKGGAADKEFDKETKAAPMMIGFAVLLAGGIILGFALPLTGARRALVAVCAAGAIALLVGQMAVGFPVAKDIEQEKEKGAGAGMGANPLAKAGGAKDNLFGGIGGLGDDNPLGAMPGGNNPLGAATPALDAAAGAGIECATHRGIT